MALSCVGILIPPPELVGAMSWDCQAESEKQRKVGSGEKIVSGSRAVETTLTESEREMATVMGRQKAMK